MAWCSRGMSTGMAAASSSSPGEWGLLAAFADLELEAEGLALQQRAEEAADLGAAAYGDVTLAGRLIASLDAEVALRLAGGLAVTGRLARATEAFVIVEGVATWLVPVAAVQSAAGLSARSVPEASRTVLSRLGLGSALRRLAGEGTTCLVHLRDGGRVEGRIARVGADFVDLAGPRHLVVPLAAIAAVQEVR